MTPDDHPTRIGRVRHVLGSTITVELDSSLSGVEPIWEGHLQPIGQVGSFVKIPQGPLTLIATVSLVGIAELSKPLPPANQVAGGERWLQVQLLGEIDGLGQFQRGVSRYPGLDDSVHFATKSDVSLLFPSSSASIRIGTLSAAPDISLSVDAEKLVTRHSAIVGSTGSGKTSTVTSILQSFASSGWESGNIVVVDPHGEYTAALATIATTSSVSNASTMLKVPYWALPAADILRAALGVEVGGATLQSRFAEFVTGERRHFAASASWLSGTSPTEINADTPIPFDIRKVWHRLQEENDATYEKGNGQGRLEISSAGDAAKLVATTFIPYGPGGATPFKGPFFNTYGQAPARIRQSLADARLKFFWDEDLPNASKADPLAARVNEWLGKSRAVSVLDFSGVPSAITELAIGVVLQILFEIATHSAEIGIGRPRPVLIVLEEAHRYLSESSNVRLARTATNRIAREGRKYGVGLSLVTQRPSELPDTALSQCGTIIALRLTNATDQGRVRAALPDSVAGLADALPALRTGEAIVVGEAVPIPTRVLVNRPSPAPKAADPSLASWREKEHENDVSRPLERWRSTGSA